MSAMPQELNAFHRTLLSIVRKTPLKRGAARAWFKDFFQKRIAYPIKTDFRGIPIILNLDNTTEQKALFGFYDLAELRFLKEALRVAADPVFVDIGANSGFYTQNMLPIHQAKIIAFEPNATMRQRIIENYQYFKEKSTQVATLILKECALGDKAGALYLDLSEGYGAAHIVDQEGDNTITVPIERLDVVLQKHHITHIDALKIDVEGYEDRVLMPFFQDAPSSLWPKRIVIEDSHQSRWQGDLLSLFAEKSYRVVKRTRGNLLLERKP